MWFPTLLSCLIIVKLSVADFGLPVTIPNLRNSIVGTIGKGVEPTNDILREMKTIRLRLFDNVFLTMKKSLQDVLGNMTEIQNNTLNSLMQAINDNQTNPRNVFDRLYSDIKFSQEQFLTTQKTALDKYTTEVGVEKFALLNMSRGALKSSLETLQTTLNQLDDSISKAQRAKPITQENIQSVVTKSQVADIALGVVSMEMSISKLYQLTESSLKSFKLIDQDANKTFSKLEEMFNIEGVSDATENRTNAIEKNLLGVIAKINNTAVSAYKSLNKNSSKEVCSIIDNFVVYFNQVVETLRASASSFRTLFGFTLLDNLANSFDYIQNMVQANLDATAFQMFKNSTFAESCVQRVPLVNESVAKLGRLLQQCVQQELEHLLEVERMVTEFIQPIKTLTMAPLEDLRTCCGSKLSRSLCLRKFTAVYLGNLTDVTSVTFRSKLDKRTRWVSTTTGKELGSSYFRIEERCVSSKDAFASLMELRGRRLECYATGMGTAS